MITLDVTIEKEKDVIVDHVVRKFVNDHEAEVENAKNANDDDQSKRINFIFSVSMIYSYDFCFVRHCREIEYERRDSRRDRGGGDREREKEKEKEKEKERKRSKRSRSRERKRDKRDKSRDKRDKERKERKPEYGEIKVKEEPIDDGKWHFFFYLFLYFANIPLFYFNGKHYQGNIRETMFIALSSLLNYWKHRVLIIQNTLFEISGPQAIQIKLIGSINLTQSTAIWLITKLPFDLQSQCSIIIDRIFSYFLSDYPDYNSRIYSTYGTEIKYEDGEEQKYRPQVS